MKTINYLWDHKKSQLTKSLSDRLPNRSRSEVQKVPRLSEGYSRLHEGMADQRTAVEDIKRSGRNCDDSSIRWDSK